MRLECEIIHGTNIVGLCNTLDIAATKNSVKEVSFYLKKAKVAWIKAEASRKTGKQRDIGVTYC